MAGIRIEGNISGNVAEVANGYLQVVNPSSNTQAGYVVPIFENDAGFATGVRYRDMPYTSKLKRLSVGVDTVLGAYTFTPTTQHTGDFKFQNSTMQMVQPGLALNVNSSLIGTSGAWTNLQTFRHFAMQGDFTLVAESVWTITGSMPTNEVFEWGFFTAPTSSAAPTDGIYFRLTSSGLTGVQSFAGLETQSSVLSATPTINQFSRYKIIINKHTTSFWKDDVLLLQMDIPTNQPVPTATLTLPLCLHMRNFSTVTGAVMVRFASQQVTLKDLHTSKPWGHQLAGMGKAYQTQNGEAPHGQLASWSNASAPTAAALTNTGALATGLGGVANVTVTLAAGTDGIIFSYQNPTPTTTLPGKTLFVTGITICDVLVGAITTNPLMWAYAAAYGHTAVSLATTEGVSFVTSPTTKQPRRVPIGASGYTTTAVVGTNNGPIGITFQSPIVVNPGEFFQIIAKSVGTTPAGGTVLVTAAIDHYFE